MRTVASAGNDNGTYTFTYDDQGRVIGVTEPFGVSLSFGYDQYGNRNLVEDNFGGVETSVYNADGELLSRVLTESGVTMRVDFTYDQFGRVLSESRYSNAAGTALVARTTYTYDSAGNATSMVSEDIYDTTLDEFYYTYTDGQLVSETDYQPAIDGSPVTTDYSYDSQGELTAAGSTSYSYDATGNSSASGYTYNGTYKNEITSDGTWDYSYDAEGNITGKTNISTGDYWTYGYDNRNQMIQAKEFASDSSLEQEVDYKYDVFGNRVETDVTISGTTTVTKFAIDGWNPAKSNPVGNEDYDVWADLNGDGSLATRYLRGDNVDQLLGRVDVIGGTGTGYWTLTDNLGSVRDVIDNTGTIKDSLQYDSFGNIDTSPELDPTYRGRYAYTGREFDVETQLQYNRARYYDATTGRWISQDPMGFDAGDSNLYRYVHNQPTQESDPSGLEVRIPLAFLLSGVKADLQKQAQKEVEALRNAHPGLLGTLSGNQFFNGKNWGTGKATESIRKSIADNIIGLKQSPQTMLLGAVEALANSNAVIVLGAKATRAGQNLTVSSATATAEKLASADQVILRVLGVTLNVEPTLREETAVNNKNPDGNTRGWIRTKLVLKISLQAKVPIPPLGTQSPSLSENFPSAYIFAVPPADVLGDFGIGTANELVPIIALKNGNMSLSLMRVSGPQVGTANDPGNTYEANIPTSPDLK